MTKKSDLSSYEKGIQNLLDDIEKFEAIIWAYVLRVNSNFYSSQFPSTQIAKIIVSKLKVPKTKYALFHKVIRIILNKWKEEGICELISNPSSMSSKKTKEIYQFKEEGIDTLKARFIDKCIDDIMKNIDINKEIQVLKTRERIIEDLMYYLSEIP